MLLVVPDPRHSQAALLRPHISLRFVAHGPAGIFFSGRTIRPKSLAGARTSARSRAEINSNSVVAAAVHCPENRMRYSLTQTCRLPRTGATRRYRAGPSTGVRSLAWRIEP